MQHKGDANVMQMWCKCKLNAMQMWFKCNANVCACHINYSTLHKEVHVHCAWSILVLNLFIICNFISLNLFFPSKYSFYRYFISTLLNIFLFGKIWMQPWLNRRKIEQTWSRNAVKIKHKSIKIKNRTAISICQCTQKIFY